MAEQPGAGRLDPETLAAYVDGRLPPEERARVDAEIAADPENYEWLVSTLSVVDGMAEAAALPAPPQSPPSSAPATLVSGPRVLPFYRRRGVKGGLGVVLAVAAVMVLVVRMQPEWWQRLRGPQVDPRFAALVEAVGEERYIEARLTGGFNFGPMREVMRGPGERDEPNVSLLRATAEIQEATAADPSSDNLHALGVAYLLAGSQHGDAVAQLEAATNAARTYNALLDADLGAAYLDRGVRSGSVDDLTRAVAPLERALHVAPGLPEALYNKALTLERLGQRDPALAAWTSFLRHAPDDPWAPDARRQLAALQSLPTTTAPPRR